MMSFYFPFGFKSFLSPSSSDNPLEKISSLLQIYLHISFRGREIERLFIHPFIIITPSSPIIINHILYINFELIHSYTLTNYCFIELLKTFVTHLIKNNIHSIHSLNSSHFFSFLHSLFLKYGAPTHSSHHDKQTNDYQKYNKLNNKQAQTTFKPGGKNTWR